MRRRRPEVEARGPGRSSGSGRTLPAALAVGGLVAGLVFAAASTGGSQGAGGAARAGVRPDLAQRHAAGVGASESARRPGPGSLPRAAQSVVSATLGAGSRVFAA